MAQQRQSPQKVEDQAQSDHVPNSNSQLLNSEMAKAFQEIAQGERAASALEAKLDGIHKNLDELLASFEEIAKSPPEDTPSGASASK